MPLSGPVGVGAKEDIISKLLKRLAEQATVIERLREENRQLKEQLAQQQHQISTAERSNAEPQSSHSQKPSFSDRGPRVTATTSVAASAQWRAAVATRQT